MSTKSATFLATLWAVLATVGIATLAPTALAQAPSPPLPAGALEIAAP